MVDTVETVKVVSPVTNANPHGYTIINKSDMTDKHELFGEKKEAPPATPMPMRAPVTADKAKK